MAVTVLVDDNHRALAELSDDEKRGAGLPEGLVPVAFSFRPRRVRLLQLGGVECREPTFRQTVECWAADNPELAPVEMTWSAFVAAARQTPLPAPAGLVFNVARCGSTLLANMLATLPAAVVLKESATITILVHRLLAATGEADRLELAELLTVTLPLFGRLADTSPDGATGGPSADLPARRLFVKPHSLATGGAGTLLRLFPNTPAIFLYREPADVVASMLAKPPYGGPYGLPREQVIDAFPSLAGASADLSPAAFYAHFWRSPVEEALALRPDQLLLLDYAELVNNPVAVIERLVGHLGIDLTPETVARMASVLRVYAKDASGQVPFDAQGAHRRPPLNAVQHADVMSVVGDLYAQLERRRLCQA